MRRGAVPIVRLLAHQARVPPGVRPPSWRRRVRHLGRVLRIVGRQYGPAGRVAVATAGVRWHGVVLSYRRPHNIDVIVRAMLRCDGCDGVVVSNNDPRVALRSWLSVDDPRLRIVDHGRRRYQGVRMTLARATPARRYLMVDDDILLHGEQMQALMDRLDAEPEVPHGLNGERRDDTRRPYPYRLDQGGDGTVDHLTNVYAFTDAHLARYFERMDELGIAEPAELANGEDIILSTCGTGPPRVHRLGTIVRCASTNDPAVATHRSRAGFFEERLALVEALHAGEPRS